MEGWVISISCSLPLGSGISWLCSVVFYSALGLDVLAGLLFHMLNSFLVAVLLLELEIPLEKVPHFL